MNGRVPRYHRIAESLRDRIHAGRLTPGTRLDNQRQLAKSFGVTLMTLRQALELLERENRQELVLGEVLFGVFGRVRRDGLAGDL